MRATTFFIDVFTLSFLLNLLWPSTAKYESLDAVVLSHFGNQAFNLSISSALKYLTDVNLIYVISMDETLERNFASYFGPRVRFVPESKFPWTLHQIQKFMLHTVKNLNPKYPLNGDSDFERSIHERGGWYLQQLIKLYAGEVLGLEDYVVLDSDLCWFKPIRFIANQNGSLRTYFYTPSNQKHSPYYFTMKNIAQIVPKLTSSNLHYSGIAHHMVFVKHVLKALVTRVEEIHLGKPFW